MDLNIGGINAYQRMTDVNSNLFLKNNLDVKEEENGVMNFVDTLNEKLNVVNNKQIESDIMTQKMIRGDEGVSIHEVMLVGEEAKISLQLAMQVRNKLVEAFQEINRTQI